MRHDARRRPSGEQALSRPRERRLFAGVFVIAAAILLLELTLIRIFDVVLQANLANLIVSGAIFGLGLGGIALMLSRMPARPTRAILTTATTVFSASVLLLVAVLKWLPFNLAEFLWEPGWQLLQFSILYLALLIPFFSAGIAVATILARHAPLVDRLYFWDLVGAGLGTLGILWLPTLIGPGSMLVFIAAAGMLAAALLADGSPSRARTCAFASAGLLVLTAVFAGRIEFPSHTVKRGVVLGDPAQQIEFSRWDPVARIDVIAAKPPFARRIAYDGGSQSSAFYRFDGDFRALRARYFDIDGEAPRYNSGRYVALAHWLKRDTDQQVLVIGAAGGQETLAALVFGAARVDAVEMVCTVIEAARGRYASFIGRIYDDPRVRPVCDEGRSFLRRSQRRYDIIQIHSNHTTSSVAQGVGGADPIYLQTVEAYKEYLARLTDDGILQINYFVYPRMITTAGHAWRELFPEREFRRHVVITDGFGRGAMPTFLVKRSPWTNGEIASIRRFLSREFAPDPRWSYRLIYACGEPEAAGVPDEFFRVPLDPAFQKRLPYLVFPPTDDRPFFRDLKKSLRPIEWDRSGYVPEGTANFMNASLLPARLIGSVPMERLHLYLLGALSVAMSVVFVGVPLGWMSRRGLRGPAVLPTLVYFGCLGAGFIVIEVVLIYKFMVLIGFPIYTIATVLFALLVAAGFGSRLSTLVSAWLGPRIGMVFVLTALLVGALVVSFPYARDLALGMSQGARIAFAAALLFPLGVSLGMAFPIGIAALDRAAPGLIPWAWGVNGFMTVVGALVAVLASMEIGFDRTLLLAAGLYLVAIPMLKALHAVPEQRCTGAPDAPARF